MSFFAWHEQTDVGGSRLHCTENVTGQFESNYAILSIYLHLAPLVEPSYLLRELIYAIRSQTSYLYYSGIFWKNTQMAAVIIENRISGKLS